MSCFVACFKVYPGVCRGCSTIFSVAEACVLFYSVICGVIIYGGCSTRCNSFRVGCVSSECVFHGIFVEATVLYWYILV